MKSTLVTALILSTGCLSLLRAQQVDVYLGFGTARDSSTGQSFSTQGDQTLYPAPSMGGVFPDFGINVFLKKSLGVGWTASWRGNHDYAGLQYRPVFHTFDAVYQPPWVHSKRSVPELRAGIGVAGIHYDLGDQGSCDVVPGCPSSHYFVGHVAVAARVYVKSHFFLRPAVDVQYVKAFAPFGSNWVPRYSMSFGYSFGKE
jgi:hypothetical protein